MQCYKKVGLEATVRFLDNLKNLRLCRSDKSCSLHGCLRCARFLPIKQKIIEEAHERVAVVKKQYEDGIITEGERQSKIISIWTEVSDVLSEELFKLISEVERQTHESSLS